MAWLTDIKNKLFVIESDEFNKHFLAYHPTIAVITNIELDHTECYPGGLEEIKDTFKKFGNKAEQVVSCGDDSNIRDIKFDKDVIYYGFNDNNNVVAKNVKLTDKGSEFDVYINNELSSNLNSTINRQNVANSIFTNRTTEKEKSWGIIRA